MLYVAFPSLFPVEYDLYISNSSTISGLALVYVILLFPTRDRHSHPNALECFHSHGALPEMDMMAGTPPLHDRSGLLEVSLRTIQFASQFKLQR